MWADSVNEEQVEKSESCGDEMKINVDWRLWKLEEDVQMQKVIIQLLVLAVFVLIVLLVILYCKWWMIWWFRFPISNKCKKLLFDGMKNAVNYETIVKINSIVYQKNKKNCYFL